MKENKKVFFAIFTAIVVITGIIYFFWANKELEEVNNMTSDDKQAPGKKEKDVEIEIEIEDEVYIQLCGAILKEGVYKLKAGTRVFEAVSLAGGLTVEAAPNAVNQARVVKDGEIIYFPTKEDEKNGEYQVLYETDYENSLININTASKEQLMSLPGIGEAKANSIIKYRESNNGFKELEEIMQVSGIKDALYQNIKDFITN